MSRTADQSRALALIVHEDTSFVPVAITIPPLEWSEFPAEMRDLGERLFQNRYQRPIEHQDFDTLTAGGPGSGRYPKGSGKRPRGSGGAQPSKSLPPLKRGKKPTRAEHERAKAADPNAWSGKRGQGDSAVYLEAAGYNELPTVLSTDEFDAVDSPVLWRGLEAKGEVYRNADGTREVVRLTQAEVYERTISDPPDKCFIGTGYSADGTYIGSPRIAKRYTGEAEREGASPKPLSWEHTALGEADDTVLLRLKVHPDAKMATLADLPGSMQDLLIPDQVTKYLADRGFDGLDISPDFNLNHKPGDPYDTVQVIFNRAALIIESLGAE